MALTEEKKNTKSTKIKNWVKDLPKERYVASGGRKTSMARVYVYANGSGESQLIVNGVKGEEYFSTFMLTKAMASLVKTGKQYSAVCKVEGGGITGQSEAISHAIGKALVKANVNFRSELKSAGMLTRDARMVESKKVGRHKARRSKQWSKR